MNELEIIELNGQRLVDSREVAEMIEMRHDNLIRKVCNYVDILTNSKLSSLDFFIPGEYKDTKGEFRKCYFLTKQGCEMVANKLTGEKGILFTAKYVEAFNKMEQSYLPSSDPMKALELMFEATKQTNEKVEVVDKRVETLENNMTIDTAQQYTLSNLAKKNVLDALGGKESQAYKEVSKKVFAAMWRDFKNYFKVPSYRDTLKINYQKAIEYLETWHPDTNLQIEIDSWNGLEIVY